MAPVLVYQDNALGAESLCGVVFIALALYFHVIRAVRLQYVNLEDSHLFFLSVLFRSLSSHERHCTGVEVPTTRISYKCPQRTTCNVPLQHVSTYSIVLCLIWNTRSEGTGMSCVATRGVDL